MANFNLPALSDDMKGYMQEEFDGLYIQFDQVKMPSGGGLAFEVPGENPDQPDMVRELVGVIVDRYPTRAYWSNPDVTGTSPDCFSNDGKTGVGNPGGACATCPMNQWGSSLKGGRGKACKEMHRIYLLREGEMLPLLLTLPPTSIKNLSTYVRRSLMPRQLRSHHVVTKISLKRVNGSGNAYSEAVFQKVRELTPEERMKIENLRREIMSVTRSYSVADQFAEKDDDDSPFA